VESAEREVSFEFYEMYDEYEKYHGFIAWRSGYGIVIVLGELGL